MFEVKSFRNRQFGTHTLSFKDFKGCGTPDFHGVKDANVATRWIANIKSAQLTSFFPKGSKVQYVAGCLRDRAKDWWDAVSDLLGSPAIKVMT